MTIHPSILQSLNEPQARSVQTDNPHLLVLAGAGSGKTRVLAHRAAYLVGKGSLAPANLMALTFTNKAARNLCERITQMVEASKVGADTAEYESFRFPWVGTFHGMAHRLLRLHTEEAHLVPGFNILDADDSRRLIRRILKDLGAEGSALEVKNAAYQISRWKNHGERSGRVVPRNRRPEESLHLEVYKTYEAECERLAVVDFDELLLRSFELLQNDALLAHYQAHFLHLMIDEFQDTSALQYRFFKSSWGSPFLGRSWEMMTNPSMVGAARASKIFSTSKRTSHRLRPPSLSKTIAPPSASLCRQSCDFPQQNRLGKTLWTGGEAGEQVRLFSAFNEYEEADFVLKTIQKHRERGRELCDVAVLYRSHAQSRVLENALIRAQTPYRVYGGHRFYERAEIKDALAYMRLVFNGQDNLSFERAIAVPSRGVGAKRIELLSNYAAERGDSLYDAAKATLLDEAAPAPLKIPALRSFVALIEKFRASLGSPDLRFHEWCAALIIESGLEAHYADDKAALKDKTENLKELVNAAVEYNTESAPLLTLLTNAALDAGEEYADSDAPAVTLMTLHASKGLEFPLVFLVGLEEGVFPSGNKADSEVEEERRLCYVGMTRAMAHLYLSHAENRSQYGRQSFAQRPSRFLKEIPESLLHPIRKAASLRERERRVDFASRGRTPYHAAPELRPFEKKGSTHFKGGKDGEYQIGTKVYHPTFGEGIVLGIQGEGEHARLQIRFRDGVKWLIASFAALSLR